MSASLPASVQANPRPDKWLGFDAADRSVRLAVGKVEIGQGVLTALRQIAAEELDVDLDRIRVISGDTERAPDEGSTSSSLSIEVSGASVRLISAEVRARMLDRVAQRLNCAPQDITVTDGVFLRAGEATGQDYWTIAPQVDLEREADGLAAPKPRTAYTVVGRPARRIDLPGKLGGGAFIQDTVRPDMLHARILRQPAREARLVSLDEAAIRRAAQGEHSNRAVGQLRRVGQSERDCGSARRSRRRGSGAMGGRPALSVRRAGGGLAEGAGHRASRTWCSAARCVRHGRRGDLFPALCRPCGIGAVLRIGRAARRTPDHLEPLAGDLSIARGASEGAGPSCREHHSPACAKCWLLRT